MAASFRCVPPQENQRCYCAGLPKPPVNINRRIVYFKSAEPEVGNLFCVRNYCSSHSDSMKFWRVEHTKHKMTIYEINIAVKLIQRFLHGVWLPLLNSNTILRSWRDIDNHSLVITQGTAVRISDTYKSNAFCAWTVVAEITLERVACLRENFPVLNPHLPGTRFTAYSYTVNALWNRPIMYGFRKWRTKSVGYEMFVRNGYTWHM